MDKWNQIPNDEALQKTADALKANGIESFIVSKGKEAFNKVFELIPQGSEVMTMSSVTLDTLGISKEINESGKFNSVKNKLSKMNRDTKGREMQRLGAAPKYAVGSVHAVTENGEVIVASNTGSQMPSYAYGSDKVIWVVGAQKVVKNLDEGIKRISEYVLPLESKRVRDAGMMPHSNVSKLLVINKEVRPGRLVLILVRERLGF